jgi:hypothetical protein
MSEPKQISTQFQAQNPLIASYNYTDVAEGTGVLRLYPFLAGTDAGDLFYMNSNPIYSRVVWYGGSEIVKDGTYHTSINETFSLSAFNTPKTIKGTAMLSFTGGTSSTGSPNYYAKFTISIMKNGVSIADEISPEIIEGERIVLPMIVPETHFKKGDILQIQIIGEGKRATSADRFRVIIGVDPMNREDTTTYPYGPSAKGLPSIFTADIPFRIEI